jgi:flagellar hook-associated protein 2
MNLTAEMKGGFFSINGVQVTVEVTDTLQDVFNAIKTATGDDVYAQYSSATDTVTLTSQGGNDIVLGSAADTSNFLSLMRLYSGEPGISSVVSTHKLGVVNVNSSIANSGLSAEASIASSGSFTLNGVVIDFDKTTDSLRTLIDRVENSASGMRLVYDKLADQFRFENKETGNLGFTLEDTSGGLLAALGLVGGGALTTLGDNAAFSVNGGVTITSTSNHFDASSHGVEGLTIKAQALGSETIEVLPDSHGVRGKIDTFIAKFNEIQNFIEVQTKITVGSNGKITKGALGGNQEVKKIGDTLRKSMFEVTNPSSLVVARLADLGIDFSAMSSKLSIKSESTLTSMLSDNPNDVASYFTATATGLGSTIESLLNKYTKSDGIIDAQEDSLKSQIQRMENDILREERTIKSQKTALEKSFMKMDQAQSQMQMQGQALLKMFE